MHGNDARPILLSLLRKQESRTSQMKLLEENSQILRFKNLKELKGIHHTINLDAMP